MNKVECYIHQVQEYPHLQRIVNVQFLSKTTRLPVTGQFSSQFREFEATALVHNDYVTSIQSKFYSQFLPVGSQKDFA